MALQFRQRCVLRLSLSISTLHVTMISVQKSFKRMARHRKYRRGEDSESVLELLWTLYIFVWRIVGSHYQIFADFQIHDGPVTSDKMNRLVPVLQFRERERVIRNKNGILQLLGWMCPGPGFDALPCFFWSVQIV